LALGIAVPLLFALAVVAQEKSKENKPLASIKLEIHEDIPYAQVRVNDSEPLWFVVDSGASACVIDKAQCKALDIPTEGQREGTGAGAGTVTFHFVKDARYTVAKESFKADQSYAIDLSGVSTPKDRKLAGLLGYDFFQRYIVVLNYDKSVMELYDPKKFDYRGAGEAMTLAFKKKIPYVKGKIKIPGQKAAEREWLVDTGSGDALNDDLLAESTGEKNKVTGGRGLGKEFEITQATADRVDLGRFSFEKVAGVSGGMKIGGGLLRNFTVVLDYSGERMILEPNRHYRK
jgi:hypothetical protein